MAYLVIFLAVLTRFVPHLPNSSPVFGALLFSGAYLRPRDSIWFPVALLAASDVVLTTQVYHMRMGWGQVVVWAAFAIVALIGRCLRNRISVGTVLAAAVAGPLVFFLISNFAVWLEWKMYPPSWQGLLACYAAAVPFFRSTLLSSLVSSAALFGTYELYRRKFEATHPEGYASHRG
jgi:uncharacterized protein DUF6580